jgi:hypothetical protein
MKPTPAGIKVTLPARLIADVGWKKNEPERQRRTEPKSNRAGRANREARLDVSEDDGRSADLANRRRRRSIRREHEDEEHESEEHPANRALHPTRAGVIMRAHG